MQATISQVTESVNCFGVVWKGDSRWNQVILLESEAICTGGSTHGTGSLRLLGAVLSPGPAFHLLPILP